MTTCELIQQVPSVYLVEQVLYEVWGLKLKGFAAKMQRRAHHVSFLKKKSLFSTETILCSTKQRSVSSVATCNVFGSLAIKQLWNTTKQ